MCLRPSSLKRISPVSPSISTWKLNRNQRVRLLNDVTVRGFRSFMGRCLRKHWAKKGEYRGWWFSDSSIRYILIFNIHVFIVTFQDFLTDSMALWSIEWYIYNSMCENESKMWNGIFSFEFSFSRKSNLKIFRTRVNLIQCPYEWIIDKGLCYVKKNLEKNIFIFKALRSKSNFWIWKLFDLLRDFNSFLRIKKKKKLIFNYNFSKWKSTFVWKISQKRWFPANKFYTIFSTYFYT